MKLRMIIWTTVLIASLYAQSPPSAFQPTEIQNLRLQVKQRDAQLAQRDFQTAQARFQTAIAELTNEAEKIKTDNKWDKTVQFDPNTLTFSAAPKPTLKEPKKP